MRLLKAVMFPPCFTLDPDIGLEEFVYPDGTAPYFGGEMVGTFHLPPIEQEVNFFEENKRRYDTTGLV